MIRNAKKRYWEREKEKLKTPVSGRLRTFKKPKSMVKGDLFPQCVTKFCDQIAMPLCKKFNTIIATKRWPAKWKMETTTIIPKSSTANNYDKCRNLACTPLFSKVMESFLMDRINAEVKIDGSQYGGIKRCGTEHFLTQAWDNILGGLEDNRTSINLISIDYAKAYNRMSHQHCLDAFKRKRASQATLGLICAFLTGRKMQVKVGETLSALLDICDGSPQGCVSVNALFCATIEALQDCCILMWEQLFSCRCFLFLSTIKVSRILILLSCVCS